ncbi:hypothetical protein [Conservatibacter flavescens]|nr:hypothetical protein [Conservatibacter flavescens]
MFKEDGYDEFLAEKIARARAEYAEGKYYTFEEFDQIMNEFLEKNV